MSKATSERRRCEVCGDPIRENNKYGICVNGSKPECMEARRRKRPQRAPEPRLRSSRLCDVCGRSINRNNQSGICGRPGSPECAKERKRREREGFAADLDRPAITTGERFGHWTALETCGTQKHYVLCRCDCGVVKRVLGEKLIAGLSRSCGCTAVASMVKTRFSGPYIPAGAVFGRLTVLEDVPRSNGRAMCRCECGNKKDVNAIGLKNGSIKSCNCLGRERRSKLNGFSKHPLYATWNGIIDRCTDPKSPSYERYGGRGITICGRWRDPWLFAEDIYREIGPRPEDRDENGRVLYELDRINNDRGYWCGRCAECAGNGQVTINVRWADKKTQRANQRTVTALTRERDALAAELAALKASLE